ncbi:hypothetical protein EVJ58_g8941 [Rhodofomes roseus]|uniref:beta-N-acetylhexosaminidase n=1 Tax=Rhodofomes roseus TaxID=34475 RepID=A0A4Y9Y0C1_9APHY|nr:hypothetical protein EVJ58_g8941 [Rhodofomes roseus]
MMSLWLVLSAAVSLVSALWPLPQNLTQGNTALRLSGNFDITISPGISEPPQDLYDAISRTRSHLFTDDLGRLVVGRGAGDVSTFETAAYLSSLTLSLEPGSSVLSITAEAQKPLEERDEAYTLTVPSNGSVASITATSTLGLLRGLTTFEQLWYEYDGTIYAVNTPIQIEDAPAYINEFNWHISDSQSFPLQIPGYMELSEYGAYSPQMIYSPSDVEYIVSYAGARGIDVMVEIDTPGHTSIIGESHPEFIACYLARPWASYAGEPPAGQLRFANATVANWSAELFTAVAQMFPSSMVSTGGDEIQTYCYDMDEETQYDLNSTGRTFNEALTDYVRGTHGALAAAGKTPAVWEEMVLDYNLSLSSDTLVLVWISSDDVKAVVDQGFRVIHAASNYFYLDCGAGEWVGGDPTGNSWCDPFKTWQYAYTFDPLANLTSDQYSQIMGGESPGF